MKFRSLSLPIVLDEAMSASGKAPEDVQVMRTGNFVYQGKSLDVTTDMFKSMIKNFSENVRGIDLAVDYKHDSDDIAAGWFKSLYLKNNGSELWAKVNWTANGNKVLSDREFRYLSADFVLNFAHNETKKEYGPTLLGAGLTNRPFIKDMEPVVNLSEPSKGKQMDEKDKQIADLQAQIAALKKQIEDDGKSEGDQDQPQMADVKKENDSLKAQCADMQKKIQAFEASAAKVEEDKKLAEKKSVFDQLMVAGKAVEAQREAFMSGDTVKFAESFTKPNLGGKGSSNDAPATAKDSEDAQNQIIKFAEKAVIEKRAKDVSEGQKLALRENPELAKKIYG